ncbi:hypothetical protein [Streptomyces sp. NPDC048527]|uniref:hypothetical protein n=1 Tax=Streptomyces sp. NPDC048527 TaxID=3365568 RepID=UPI00370F8DF9
MVLLLGASLAVVVFFVRDPVGRHWWRTGVAPGLAALGLGIAVVLVLFNYRYLTGTRSVLVNGLTLLIPVALAGGAGRFLWLRSRDSEAVRAVDPSGAAG